MQKHRETILVQIFHHLSISVSCFVQLDDDDIL